MPQIIKINNMLQKVLTCVPCEVNSKAPTCMTTIKYIHYVLTIDHTIIERGMYVESNRIFKLFS